GDNGGGDNGGDDNGGDDNGGVVDPGADDNTDVNGGGNDPVAQEKGSSALTDTGDDATSAQGDGKELAETGAAETTFLLIGAATMIAGGIGFRFLPRMVAGRGAAA
ncbi:LPXTG cell wall anchor domain-containing protein, partial [Streptomyces poonensis]